MNDASTRRRGPASLALMAGLALGAVAFLAVAATSIQHTPGIGGWIGGIVGGLFVGLLVAGAGAWLAMSIAAGPMIPKEIVLSREPVMQGTLETTLAELEAIRGRTHAQINGRARVFVPLCAIGGLIAWILGRFSDDPPGFFDAFWFVGVGAAAGYFWASAKLGNAYRRLYKQRVLPVLAAQFGNLTYRQAVPDLEALRKHRLFDKFDGSTCEDEIVGDYRDLPLSIVELNLICGSGDDKRTIFDGLLTTVTLPRSLAGTTVVVPNRGAVGNLKDRLLGGSQPVVVEDPNFQKAFQVYGTDQIAARALLTPAFMERFLRFSESGRFGMPTALVEGPRLTLALSKGSAGNLFEPPSYSKPAAARDAIRTLSSDIEHVLAIADAVIDLDYFARIRAEDARARDAATTAVPPTP